MNNKIEQLRVILNGIMRRFKLSTYASRIVLKRFRNKLDVPSEINSFDCA